MPKISVVIPIYNAERYIRDCLDSIINQSLKDIEIICVDDGSTDNSVAILQEYAERDGRIKVIQQKNEFAGVARNNGLSIATGEYLHFMDADDLLFDGVYESLMALCEQKQYPNIIRFKAQAFDDATGGYVEKKYYEMKNLEDKLNSYLNIDDDFESIFSLSVTPWQGVIKREFVLENGLKFNNLRCCNDRSFFIASVLKARGIFVSDILVVNHRVNNESSLVGIRAKNFDCHYKSVAVTIDFCRKNDIEKSLVQKVVVNELSDTFTFFKKFFFLPNSYERYMTLSEFVKALDKDFVPDDIGTKWFAYTYFELLKTPKMLLGLTYLIKRYIFNVNTSNPKFHRCILFGCIKLRVRRKII